MLNLTKEIKDAKTIGISAHIHPDGDAVGSTMGLYLYLRKNRPELDVHVFLEKPADIFNCIKDIDIIEDAGECEEEFDIFFAIDCGKERLGAAEHIFERAKRTINIDHHVSNPGTGDYNYIDPKASSASELVFDLLDTDSFDEEIAKALYIGIIHDTGVMQYSNTSPKTLNAVSKLISYGFDFNKLIDETFYQKSYLQTKIMGKALSESVLKLEGRVAVGIVSHELMDEYNVTSHDLDGIVSQLRYIKGVDVAMFMYQLDTLEYKVSLRSNGVIDVAKVTGAFGGGGHVRAAGCTLSLAPDEIIQKVLCEIEAQYKELK